MRLNAIDYKIAMHLNVADIPFSALVAAAMVKADTRNMEALKRGFPGIHEDLYARYNAPGGVLPRDFQDGVDVDNEAIASMSRRAADVANSYLSQIELES